MLENNPYQRFNHRCIREIKVNIKHKGLVEPLSCRIRTDPTYKGYSLIFEDSIGNVEIFHNLTTEVVQYFMDEYGRREVYDVNDPIHDLDEAAKQFSKRLDKVFGSNPTKKSYISDFLNQEVGYDWFTTFLFGGIAFNFSYYTTSLIIYMI